MAKITQSSESASSPEHEAGCTPGVFVERGPAGGGRALGALEDTGGAEPREGVRRRETTATMGQALPREVGLAMLGEILDRLNLSRLPRAGAAGGRKAIDRRQLRFNIPCAESGFQHMEDGNRYRYVTRSVERALTILHLFVVGEAEISLSDISRRVGLHQSTVFRLLATLRAAGFVEQNPHTGRHRLGPAALSLGQAFLRHSDLRQIAQSPLANLRDRSGETVHLATLVDTEVIYLEKLPGLHPIGLMSSRVGDRAPSHCTGLGKALLAHEPEAVIRDSFKDGLREYTPKTITRMSALLSELAKVRQLGYALDDEEHEQGVVCVAAPVFDSRRVVAAISVAGPADRIREEIRSSELNEQILAAANEISAKLGRVAAVPSKESALSGAGSAGRSKASRAAK